MLGKVFAATGAVIGVLGLSVGAVVLGGGDPSASACGSAVADPTSAGTHAAVDGYSGDQLTNAAAIINAGSALGVGVEGDEIGVMTAMGESGLRILDHGDQAGPDSRGLFQQRTSWGPLAQRMNATDSATLFFQRLVKVPDWQAMTPTAAAHAVQVNADPNYYAPYFPKAQDVVLALTAGTAACTGSNAIVDVDWAGGGGGFTPNQAQVQTALAFAEQQLGKAYVFGGAGPNVWDCSGLTMVAYQQADIDVGTHSVTDQYETMQAEGRLVPYADAEPGDLLFWHESDGAWEHVGFYLGNGQVLSAAKPGEGVKIQKVWVTGDGETLAPLVGRPTGTPFPN